MIGMVMVWLTIVAQMILIIQNRAASIPETLIRFFSFFTILTNTLVALYFTTRVENVSRKPFHVLRKDSSLTAIAVFILVVGIVYQLILRPIWEPTGVQLVVDELLHTIIPLYFFIYWFISLKNTELKIRPVLSWLIYPGVYIVFILIRGHYSGYYPYPFLNVDKIGFTDVLGNSVAILGSIILLMYVLIVLGKMIKKKGLAKA